MSMEQLQFDEITIDDVAIVANILSDATAVKSAHGDMAWGVEGWSEEEVIGCMDESTSYIVRTNGEAMATVSLQWEDEDSWGEQPPIAGYMHRLAVKKGMNGQGLGERVIGWAATQVAAKGRMFLRLDCPADNESLCKYYEKQGFIKVGQTKDTGYENYEAALYEKLVTDLARS